MSDPCFVKSPTAPRPEDGRDNLVKYVELTENTKQEPRVCKYIRMETCLLIEYLKEQEHSNKVQDVLDKLMLIKFKECSEETIQDVLQLGIFCKEKYYFLGHSSEQLEERSCLMMCETREQIHDKLVAFADFHEVYPIHKRAEQIGALFSCFTDSVKLEEDEFQIIDASVTNGCGFMSPQLSKQVQNFYGLSYSPGAVQVCYRAYQGLLLRVQDLQKKAMFSKSMQKFDIRPSSVCHTMDTLGIVDYSKPYTMGYLDSLTVMLLEDRGVKPDYMKKLQDQYYEQLDNITTNDNVAKYFLCYTGKIHLHTLLHTPDRAQEAREEIKRIQQNEIRKLKEEGSYMGPDGEERHKVRVLVRQSREVFGVADPNSRLKPGECFFNLELSNEELNDFESAHKLLVMCQPCYDPADIRVLKLVHERNAGPKYRSIKDCLVFPVNGSLSKVEECDGGKLGGNKYFVCWDKNLIPSEARRTFSLALWKNRFQEKVENLGKRPALSGWNFPHSLSAGCCASRQSDADEQRKKSERREELEKFFAAFKPVDDLVSEAASSNGPSSDKCHQLSGIVSGKMDLNTRREEAEDIIEKLRNEEEGTETGLPCGYGTGNEDEESDTSQEKVYVSMEKEALQFLQKFK